MLPLVINNNPSRLVQVAMSGPVGVGCNNAKNDVFLVQSLLNAVPSNEGGPLIKLKADGIAGPLTVAAIRKYQQARTHIIDGRVDVHGATIKSLVMTLNDRGALPRGLSNLGSPSQSVVNALTRRGGVASLMSRADRQPSSPPAMKAKSGVAVRDQGSSRFATSSYTGPTGWDFVTSSATDVSVWIIGATVINIVMKHDIEPGLTYQFTFAGAGVGLSGMPIGLDWSASAMPSYGTRLWKVNPLFGKAPPLYAHDFDLLPTLILAFGANVGPGWGGMVVFWGSVGPLLSLTRYVNAVSGMQAGIPGGTITLYTGAIAGWI
jgi:hypothetical protein